MFKFVNAIAQSNFRRLSSPFKLSYAVTYRCNLKCGMCNIWNKEHVRPELSVDDAGRFFGRPHRVYWLGITGGEPFLRDDLPELVDAILSRSPGIRALHFATNGTLTSRIERLVRTVREKHGTVRIVFTLSVDGPPELHDRIRGERDVWDRMFRTFGLLKKIEGVKPQFGFTLSHGNIDKFEDTFLAMREAWPRLRFDDITVNIFQRSGFYYENLGMPPLPPALLAGQIKKILALDNDGPSLNNFLRRRYLNLYLRFLKTGKSPLRCQSMASTCFMDPYGDLYPCAVYKRKLLNVRGTELSLNAIWKLEEARQIHRECAANECPSCWSPCDAYSAIGGSLVRAMAR